MVYKNNRYSSPYRPDLNISVGGPGDLMTGLVSHWQLNEAANTSRLDSVGSVDFTDLSSNVGSVVGKVGNAASFGLTSGFTALDVPNLNLGLAFTLALWLRKSQETAGSVIRKNYFSDSEPNFQWKLSTLLSGEVTFGWVPFLGGPNIELTSSTILNLDQWYQIVVTYDGTVRIYIDGILDATGPAIDFDLVGDVGDVMMGAFDGLSAQYLGDVDEVSIANRVWSSTDVQTHYNAGVGQTFPFGA
jgi:hypothetical protein